MPSETPASIRLTPEAVVLDQGGPARVELALERSQYPADPMEVFQPQRLPERCTLTVGGPLLESLDRASVQLKVRLNPGFYNLPLASGPPCQVELPEGTEVVLRLEVGPSPGGGGPVLTAVDLRFTPALLIHNVIQTLTQVQEMVDDRYLALLKPFRPRLPEWLREASEVLVGSADTAAVIYLEHAAGRPKWRGEPTLRLAFDGRVRWLDQVETRFDRVVLPASILPVPFAALSRLFSSKPFATAELAGIPLEVSELLQTCCAAIGSVEADLSADFDAPALHVRTATIDGARMRATLRETRRLRLRGAVGADFKGSRVEMTAEDLRLSCADHRQELRFRLTAAGDLDLGPGERPLRERVTGTVEADVLPGSRWPQLLLDLRVDETVAFGETDLHLEVTDLEVQGGVAGEIDSRHLHLRPGSGLSARSRVRSPEPFRIRQATSEWSGEVEAEMEASLQPTPDGEWQGSVTLRAELEAKSQVRLSSFPEFDIRDGVASVDLAGRLALDLRPRVRIRRQNAFDVDLAGSRFDLELRRAEAHLESRRLSVPPGTAIAGHVLEGIFTPAGMRGLSVDVRWDLRRQPCLLQHGEQVVSLLTDDLRQGQLTLILDPSGKLSFAGDREGLYGVRYFNTLVNPAGDPEQLVDLLLSEDALSHVLGALSVFAPGMAEALGDVRALWLAARRILFRENVRRAGDMIPRAKIARMLSLLLQGNDSLQGRLEPIIKRVTEGKGLDLSATKDMLLQELGEFDIDYEVTALLNWLDLVFSPSEPLDPVRAEPELPLALDPAYAEARSGLPSAAQIYDAVNRGSLDEGWARRLADLAPLLTRRQLGFILSRASSSSTAGVLARLRYAYEIKQRVETIAEGYGGVEYLFVPSVIASFLGEAVGPLPGINHPSRLDDGAWPPPCALGPEDVAVLLQAGLATGRQDRRTQINNRLLLELMRRQPPSFTREVFVELGHQSPRALSGILYAFLDQDQDHLVSPLDLVDFLSERLAAPIPRQRDFMAGGHKARQSYYEALSRVADAIIAEANPYFARKAHLQTMRHPVASELLLPTSFEGLEKRARASISRADELGAACSFGAGRGGPRARARRAYEAAFRACARLLEREPRAFQVPWFKEFWVRNEEALRVLSAVRAHQGDVDRVRHWLEVRTGRERFTDEQDLLETVVRGLYFETAHQVLLTSDPLVHLLLDPPPGQYDFSIVSCMGVITDGKDGAELDDTYRRLEERRGIRILRAHTGIARSLEYNAGKIIEAVESTTTPWGVIGYSQGCANALLAESMLFGGTPEQQRLLDSLVGRNFLFSSANGSAHGSSGMLKFMRALILGERFLKHYQAMYSWEAIRAVLRLVKTVLDSRVFVGVLGGVHSLTFERARVLHRDGQFVDRVPTSLTRAIVTEDRVPEALEYLYYMLKELTWGAEQDTQVLVTDAVGSSTRVVNESTRVLARCDMTTFPQASHHWAPLTREIEFVTTERDRQLAIYETPKDCLVAPWVEVNARFGRIQMK